MHEITPEIRKPGLTNGPLSPLQKAEARQIARWVVESGITPDELSAWTRMSDGMETTRPETDLLMDTCSIARDCTGATSHCTVAQVAPFVVRESTRTRITLASVERAELEALRARVAELEYELDIRRAAE